jgi:hypothetical protein
MARRLGMRVTDRDPAPLTPLLCAGDKRCFDHLVSTSDGGRAVGWYTWTDITHDSDGRRQEHNHQFTLAILTHPHPPVLRFAAAYRKGLWLSSRGWRGARDAGKVELESTELHDRYRIECSDGDELALREVFTPAFIVWLGERDLSFEYEDGVLVVFWDDHIDEATQLLDLWGLAEEAAARFAQEAAEAAGTA